MLTQKNPNTTQPENDPAIIITGPMRDQIREILNEIKPKEAAQHMEELWEAALCSDVADSWSRYDRSSFYNFVARIKQMVYVLHKAIPGHCNEAAD